MAILIPLVPYLVAALVSVAVSALVTLIFPTKSPHSTGSRASDLNVQTSTYGTAIPLVYGTLRLAGNVIWGQKTLEVAEEAELGKVTVYKYYARFAVAFCEGPIAGYQRVWLDNKLIVSKASNGSIKQLGPVTFYHGSEIQLPNAFMESFDGVGNVPAYRGVCYMVFEHMHVTQFGGRIPVLNIELVGTGVDGGSVAVMIGTDEVTETDYAASGLLYFDTDGDTILSISADKPSPAAGTAVSACARISASDERVARVVEQDSGYLGGYAGILKPLHRSSAVGGNGNLYIQDHIPQPDQRNPGEVTTNGQFWEVDQGTFDTKQTFGTFVPGNQFIEGSVGDPPTGLSDVGTGTEYNSGFTPSAMQFPIGASMNAFDLPLLQSAVKNAKKLYDTTDPEFRYKIVPGAEESVWAISSPPTGDISLGSTNLFYRSELVLFWKNNVNGQWDHKYYYTGSSGIKTKHSKPNEFGQLIVDQLGQKMYLITYHNKGYISSGTDEGNLEAVDLISIYAISGINKLQKSKPSPIYGVSKVKVKLVAYIPVSTSPVDGAANGVMKRDDTAGAVNHVTGWAFSNLGVTANAVDEIAGLKAEALGSTHLCIANSSSRALIALTSGGNSERQGSVVQTFHDFGWYGGNQWSSDNVIAISRAGDPSELTIDEITLPDFGVKSSTVVTNNDIPNSDPSCFPDLDLTQNDAFYNSGWAPLVTRNSLNDRVILSFLDADGIRRVGILTGRTVAEGQAELSDVVTDLCARGGLSAAEIDVSELTDVPILGYGVAGSNVTVRDALEPLQQAFLFDGVESDFKLKFPLRGRPLVDPDVYGEIPAELIGKTRNGTAPTVTLNRVQEVELPTTFSVTYLDKDRDYQDGTQSTKRVTAPSQTQYSGNAIQMSLKPMVSRGEPMKQLSSRWLYSVWSERVSLGSQLGWQYLLLDPTDVINMVYRDDLIRVRLASVNIGADLSIEFNGNEEDARVNDSTLPGGGEGESGELPTTDTTQPDPLTKGIILNLPTLNPADPAPDGYFRVFFVLAGYTSTWPGGSLVQSRDNGKTYQSLGTSNIEATWGRVVGTMPDALDPNRWNSQSVTLYVERGIDKFMSVSEDEVLAGANLLAIIRNDGTCELAQFRDAVIGSNNQVTISRMLRGRYGTEPCAYGHDPAARWVLISAGGLQSFLMPISTANAGFLHKAVTIGDDSANVVSFVGQVTAQDLVPYSVCRVLSDRYDEGGSKKLLITWRRRTRFDTGWSLSRGDELPVNETSDSLFTDEQYLIEYYKIGESAPFLLRGQVFPASFLTSPSPIVPDATETPLDVLTDAQYETATGEDLMGGDIPPIEVKIFQISKEVGRGRAFRVGV